MARLYSNENFPFRVVQELRACGHEVLTSLEAALTSFACINGALAAMRVSSPAPGMAIRRHSRGESTRPSRPRVI